MRLLPLALVALALVVHAPALRLGYVADDFFLVGQVWSDGRVDLGRLAGFWVDAHAPGTPHFYRPIWRSSFALDVLLGATPVASHAIPLALHAGAAAAVALLALRLGLARGVAWTAGALFAVAPASFQAVWWVAARSDTLAVLFLVAAAAVLGARASVSASRRAAVAALALAACLSKETAPILLPALTLQAALAPGASVGFRAALRRGLAATAPTYAVAAVFVTWRAWLLGVLVGGYGGVPPWRDALANRAEALANLAHPLTDGLGAEGALAALATAGVVAWAARAAGPGSAERRAIAVGAAWCLLPLAVPIGYAATSADGHSARYLHLPSVGWSLVLVAAGAVTLRAALPRTRAAAPAAAAALLCVAVGTLHARSRAYFAADAEFAEVRAAVERAAATPGPPLLVHGVPDFHGQAPLGVNAIPSCLGPPFVALPPDRRVSAIAEQHLRSGRLSRDATVGLASGELVPLAWDRDARALVPAWPGFAVRGRGVLHRDPAGALRLAPAGAAPGSGLALAGGVAPDLVGPLVDIVTRRLPTGPPRIVRVEAVAPRLAIDPDGDGVRLTVLGLPPGAPAFLLAGTEARPRPLGTAGLLWAPVAAWLPARPGGIHLPRGDAPVVIQALVVEGETVRLTEAAVVAPSVPPARR